MQTTKTGIILKSKFAGVNWPDEWKEDFADVTRDAIPYNSVTFFTDAVATDANINLFDQVFNTKADFNAWLNSTDIAATYMAVVTISNDTTNPSYTRTAECLNQSIDYQHNTMQLTLGIRTYDGTIEQKQLYKTIPIIITTGFYGVYMGQLNQSTPIIQLLISIIKDQDQAGIL